MRVEIEVRIFQQRFNDFGRKQNFVHLESGHSPLWRGAWAIVLNSAKNLDHCSRYILSSEVLQTNSGFDMLALQYCSTISSYRTDPLNDPHRIYPQHDRVLHLSSECTPLVSFFNSKSMRDIGKFYRIENKVFRVPYKMILNMMSLIQRGASEEATQK